MEFEWDNNKNQKNLEKHGIDFATASTVFDDPKRIIEFNRIVKGELRLQTIGAINNIIIIMVVFMLRGGKHRIISARRANKNERNKYYGKND